MMVQAILLRIGIRILPQPKLFRSSSSWRNHAIIGSNTSYFHHSMKHQLPIPTPNAVTTRHIFTQYINIKHFKIPSQSLVQPGTFEWSIVSQWPSVFQQPQPLPQHQQIRTFVRRKKKRTMEKLRQRRSIMRRRGHPIYFQQHNEKKFQPLRFRTHIGRVLYKATRGQRKIECLIGFVEEYMSYDLELRKTEIIPYIRENYHRVAFESFYLRILRGITLDNNKTGMNGFTFVIQFYTDLLQVIYDKATELKTLDCKVKLMRLRLLHYDKLKRTIRKEMSQYVLEDLSSKPFPTTIPDTRKDSFPPKLVSKETKKAKGKEVGQVIPNNAVTPVESHANDNETTAEAPPPVLGCIRRVDYNDLTARFINKCERKNPMLKSKLLGTNKIVYGWYKTDQCTEPDVMVYVSLQDRIPSALAEILVEKRTTEPPEKLKVATFYGISVFDKALERVGFGEYLICPIIQQLLDDPEIPLSINQFSTLLPLYGFHNWLLRNDFEDDISLLVINDTSDDFNTLMREWECPREQVFRRLKALLCRSRKSYRETVLDKPIVATAVDNLLLRAASSYLTRAKTPVSNWRCNPLEISTRYHVAHGASIHRINLAADQSESGWEESFGIMVNHLYDLQK